MNRIRGSGLELYNRILGCLLGGAIGDAMGGPYEHSGVADNADAWVLSDDTQLTLATCEAIIATGGVYPSVIADHFLAWFEGGRITGIGASTLKALRDLARGVHWSVAGRKGEMAAGNGAAMRIAPLAFFLDPSSYDDRKTLRDVCRITHQHDEAYAGALAVVAAIRIVQEPAWDWHEPLTRRVAATLPDSQLRDRLNSLSALALHSPLADIARQYGASGYVVESVPLAIYAAQSIVSKDFAAVLREIIAVGGDTDTNASIAGQILGAWLGNEQLPRHLFERIPDHEEILAIARQLAELAAN